MECGYEVFEAGDGQEALDLFHRETPDLVLLDIQLPILNGLEVLKVIRKTSSVPVLMLTAFHDEDYKLTAFGELADGYLEKPFSLSLLKVRIEAIFKKFQPSRRHQGSEIGSGPCLHAGAGIPRFPTPWRSWK